MDATTIVAHESVSLDTLGRRIVGRRLRSLAEKQQIVAETLQPGASVADVARRHGANANLVFVWRRLHEQGLLATQRQRRARYKGPVGAVTATTKISPAAPQNPGKYAAMLATQGFAPADSGKSDTVRTLKGGAAVE